MGMFDWVSYEAPCWHCGALLKRWQSKDRECTGDILEPWQVKNFYDLCICGAWNEYEVTLRPTPTCTFRRIDRPENNFIGKEKT